MISISTTVRSLYGTKLGGAIAELHRAENDLASALLRLADRHTADSDVYYVARDISRWSREHVRRLAEVGRDYGLELDPDPDYESTLSARRGEEESELTDQFRERGLLLLSDLRSIHKEAAGVSLDWEVLAQTAQAMKDRELLGLAESCHPETLRQMRWANAEVKSKSAQIMSSS